MKTKQFSIPEFLSGGGEAGEILRTRNWLETPLGHPDHWPQSLKTCVRIILTSSQPMFVWWGKELINIYNDAYQSILGGKHPQAFGMPASEVWKEIWNEIGPRAETVMTQNTGTYDEALLLLMERNGYPEETYYTFSYSPIPGDKGGVGGIICANTNNTDLVLNERSIRTLRELAGLSYKERTLESVYASAAEVLHKNNKDFPFAIFFKVDENQEKAKAVAWSGKREEYLDVPDEAVLNAPVEGTYNLVQAINTNEIVKVKNNGRRTHIPKGFWDVIPSEFLHIPINHPSKNKPLVVLTIGLNPYRQYNDAYHDFIKLVADQISLVMNNLLAYEEERKRSKALEEIDKAKTHFFSNISHEFRTPLTLILGSLENNLQLNGHHTPGQERSNLQSAHRNALRLLRLVNMLLEFSRIEAGRMQARYQQINITELTRDLASAFQSTLENAGLKFNIQLEEIHQPVYVDVEMWEKIVLNLISNAFKYTLEGSITVSLEEQGNSCVLKVSDTGVGIPEEELPQLFKRFHRVQNAGGRSYEGTGIGLSLVYELVKLHAGTIRVESTEGKGSTFTVQIPTGKAHLSDTTIIERSDENSSTALLNTFIYENEAEEREALTTAKQHNAGEKGKTRLLVVDDNADMRNYIRNLLANEYEVDTAVNGKEALEKIRLEKPVLIISDIMMPVMDGNQLLRALKKDLSTAHIPVIFLSARAGDEAKSEGLEAGADDYLVKPFSAKEILARVRAQVKLVHTRSYVNQQMYNVFAQAPVAIAVIRGKDLIIEVANEKMLELWGKTADVINQPLMKALPELAGQGFDLLLDEVYQTGKRFASHEQAVRLMRSGKEEEIFVKFVYEPLYDENGSITGVIAVADEITQQVIAKKILQGSESRYRYLIENLPTAIYTCNAEGKITLYNQAAAELWGCEPELEKDEWGGTARLYKQDGVTELSLHDSPMWQVLRQEQVTEKEIIVERPGGEKLFVRAHPIPVLDEKGKISSVINMLMDITEQKEAQRKIKESQLLFETISNSAPVGLWISNASARCTFVNATWTNWTGISLEDTIKNGWFTGVIEQDRDRILKQFAKAHIARSYFKGEFRMMRSDGQLRWCLTEGYPFNNSDGVFMGYAGSVTDITDKKMTEEELEKVIDERTKSLRLKNEELKASEEKYHRMTEEVQDYAIILLDKEGTIMNWNSGARKIKGYTEEEIIGKNFRVFYLPEDLESGLAEKLLSTAIEMGRAVHEGWRIRKNGSTFWGSVVITALHDDQNNIIGFSKVTRDLTEKKQAEDTMKQYMAELERQNAELEQFAYVSSHDLQEPLRKIRTFSDLLETQVVNPDHRNYLKKINSSAERMSALIKDLLNYSRLSKDEEFIPVDLNQVLDNVKTDLEVAIKQKEAIIVHDQLPVLKGIPLQFNQLFLNLLSNSLKFNTAQPIIHISAKVVPLYEAIAAKLDPKWSYMKIIFSDNGIGFEPHYSEQIFTIFQRLNTRQKFSGTGIGLAMCKKIMDNHHGYIKASGSIDGGATFTLYFPLR